MWLPMDKSPYISVVICTFKRPLFLKKCIQSLLDNTFKDYEIIIVGQGPDETPRIVINEYFKDSPQIRYVHTESVGLSHARNTGCNNANGEIIAFIDDDAVASPRWLEGYAEIFKNLTPVPAMVGGRIEPDWKVQRPKWYPEERQFLLGIYNIGDTIQPFPETDLPIGANFAILKSVLEEIGGFDTRVGFDNSRKNPMIAGEDSLLALKVRDAGYSIYYQPKASILHHISSEKISRKYFLKRHFWEGVTHIVLEDCKGLATPKRMWGVFMWHINKIIRLGIEFVIVCFSYKKNSAAKRMLKLSEVAYSLGVSAKALELMLRRHKNS